MVILKVVYMLEERGPGFLTRSVHKSQHTNFFLHSQFTLSHWTVQIFL